MSKNNNFDNEHRSDLDEYLSKEITQYYGEDVIKNITSSSAPIPPKRRRHSRLISALSIICAVLFLTGAFILSGVFFTFGISGFKNSQDTESGIASNTSHSVEAESDSAVTSSAPSTDSDTSADTSTDNLTSEESSDTDNVSEIYENSQDIYSSTVGSSRITDYFSLPEYPNGGTLSDVDTDVNNNSSTNPNDNVTTGKKFRAGLGVLFMVLSLLTAVMLDKIRN